MLPRKDSSRNPQPPFPIAETATATPGIGIGTDGVEAVAPVLFHEDILHAPVVGIRIGTAPTRLRIDLDAVATEAADIEILDAGASM